jgi:hypothetical protein
MAISVSLDQVKAIEEKSEEKPLVFFHKTAQVKKQ